MEESRWNRIDRLFREAGRLSPEERAPFLERECSDDPELRAEVEKLLKHDTRSGQFEGKLGDLMGRAASSLVEHAHPSPRTGETIGPFTLVEHLGDGGFGTVYVAEQVEPIQRRVALKLIRRGMATDDVIARFEVERQALALMDHPNIARVYDAGTTDEGQPYFTMELVSGPTLIDYCDEQRLDVRRRLELFRQVCLAVHHAHQKGILHRDLKPSNILVGEHDGQAAPKVIDFGIARAVEAAPEGQRLTGTMQLVGTPEYMSPEQADPGTRGIDTRSDVYSLGAVLYELLTGATPLSDDRLRAAGLEEILRMLREEDPPKPSERLTGGGEQTTRVAQRRSTEAVTLGRRIRGDLDWIVMKALEKDPRRRYDSVSRLAEDIERHLSDQPVIAGPPSAGYRMRKFVRRHRVGVTSAALVLIALAAGLTAALVGLERARSAELQAQTEARTANRVSEFLIDLFRVSTPSRPGTGDVTARELLDKGVERIDEELIDEPEVRGRMMGVMGQVYNALDVTAKARELTEESLRLHRERHPGDHEEIATTLLTLGGVAYNEGDLDEARAHYGEALEMRRRLFGNDDTRVALALQSLAKIDRYEGEHDRAVETVRAARDIHLRDAAGEVTPALVDVNTQLASYLMAQGKSAEAEERFAELLDQCIELYGEEHAATAEVMSDYAVLLRNREAFDEAEKMYVRTLEIRRAVFGDDHTLTAQSVNNLAVFTKKQGDIPGAIELYREALAIYERVAGPDNVAVAFPLHNLAQSLADIGENEEALTHIRRALRVYRTEIGESHWVTMYFHSSHGEILGFLGRDAEAEAELKAGYEGLLEAVGARRPHTKAAAGRLVEFYESTGRPELADPYREAKPES